MNARLANSAFVVTAPDSTPLTISGFNPTIDNYFTVVVNPTATSDEIGFNLLTIRPLRVL